jgi:hypothetical protein
MVDRTGTSARAAARSRVMDVVRAALDKYIPADVNQPMPDGKFWEWEQMADAFDREVTAAFLEELAGVSQDASLVDPGNCPFCGSVNTKWLEEAGKRERQSKHGVVVLPRQTARCRPCGRSFSPPGATLGLGSAGASDAGGGGAGEPRVGSASV